MNYGTSSTHYHLVSDKSDVDNNVVVVPTATKVLSSDGIHRSMGEGDDLLQQQGRLVNNKRGHKCCGGCCDMRRAVIIVNAVNIAMIVNLIGVMVAFKYYLPLPTLDDDTEMATLEEAQNAAPIVGSIIFSVIRMMMSVIGIMGAIQYNVNMVRVAALTFCLVVIRDILAFNVLGLIVMIFFVMLCC